MAIMVKTEVPSGSFSYTLVLYWGLENCGRQSLTSNTWIITWGEAEVKGQEQVSRSYRRLSWCGQCPLMESDLKEFIQLPEPQLP